MVDMEIVGTSVVYVVRLKLDSWYVLTLYPGSVLEGTVDPVVVDESEGEAMLGLVYEVKDTSVLGE